MTGLSGGRLGRIPAVLVTAILGFTMLGAMAWIAVVQMTHLSPKIPEYQNNIQAKLSSVNEYAADKWSKITKQTPGVGAESFNSGEGRRATRDQSNCPSRCESFPRQ